MSRQRGKLGPDQEAQEAQTVDEPEDERSEEEKTPGTKEHLGESPYAGPLYEGQEEKVQQQEEEEG